MNTQDKIRVDKWLWAARFFKTRALAATAVNGGKVHVNGHRVKSSRKISINDKLKVTRGQYQSVVRVIEISEKRGPAKEAQMLYKETPESIKEREINSQQRKIINASMPRTQSRPNKYQRRQIRKASGRS